MRLDDALLYFVLDIADVGPDGVAQRVKDAIAGGADVIQLAAESGASVDRAVVEVAAGACREDDALLLVRDDATLASEVPTNGVHLHDDGGSIGLARAMVGDGLLVGVSTRSIEDATVALEIGADYLLHYGGAGAVIGLAGMRDIVRVPLFAAGLAGLEDARSVVDGGVYRLCVESVVLDEGDVTGQMAEYARLLGRCI